MNNEEIIKAIRDYADSSSSHLHVGDRNSYSMGFHNGVCQAKTIIKNILGGHTIK